MTERPSHRDPSREQTSSSETETTPDHLEQRQRPDGGLDEPGTVTDATDEPLSPDMVEQRQRRDGSIEAGAVEGADEPLSADMIEQRQVVEDDDDDDRRTES